MNGRTKFFLPILCALLALALFACDWGKKTEEPTYNGNADLVSASDFTMTETRGALVLSNATESYFFTDKITVSPGATWVLSADEDGQNIIASGTAPLTVGDNTFYLTVTSDDNKKTNKYVLSIRRRPVYTVRFSVPGENDVSIAVEEDALITAPTFTRAGYTLSPWSYDLTKPIKKDETITSSWQANTDTPYAVEYYLENVDNDDYTLYERVELTGTTDTAASAEIKTYEHFTFTGDNSVTSGNIDSDGSLVLKIYYTRDVYSLSFSAEENVSVEPFNASYKYGTTPDLILKATFNNPLGYEWDGWYRNGVKAETSLTLDLTESIVEGNAAYVAKSKPVDGMQNLVFTSDTTVCTVTGVVDKTVTSLNVPSYVTNIAFGAFDGCVSLVDLTLPFLGDRAGKTFDDKNNYPLGYVFGSTEREGTTMTRQPYFDDDWNYIDEKYAIPDSLRTVTVTNGIISDYAFVFCANLTNITLPETTTRIGENAFLGCSSLTSIRIPAGVKRIDYQAFYGCTSLRRVDCDSLADWYSIRFDSVESNPLYYAHDLYVGNELVTDLVVPDTVTTLYPYAFSGASIKSATVPDSVTSIGESVFYGCSSLVDLSLPFVGCKPVSNNTERDQYPLGYFFGNQPFDNGIRTAQMCIDSRGNRKLSVSYYIPSTLRTVTVTGGAVLSITAFQNCSMLTSVTLAATQMIEDYAFSSCSNLTSITLPGTITCIKSSAFYACDRLSVVYWQGDLSSWCKIDFYEEESNPLTYAHNLYINGTLLTDLVVPDTVETIEAYVFSGATAIKSVSFGNSVKSIYHSAFIDCAYESFNFTGAIEDWCNIRFADQQSNPLYLTHDFYVNGEKITSLVIPDAIELINKYAFACSSISSITFGGNVKEIEYRAFQNCSLTSFNFTGTIGDWCNIRFDNLESNPLYFAHDFYVNGEKITSLVIPDTIKKINEYAFAGASISSVSFPDGLETICEYAFLDCTGLTSLIVPNSVTTIGRSAFAGCSSLVEITLPFVGKYSDPLYQYAFGCIFGEEEYEGGTATTQESHSDSAFSLTKTTYYIPASLTKVTVTGGIIYEGAFSNCSALTNIIITSEIDTINQSAFISCSALTSLTLPSTIEDMYESALQGCSSLTDIYFGGTMEEWGYISFDSDWDTGTGNYTVHCNDGNIEKEPNQTE